MEVIICQEPGRLTLESKGEVQRKPNEALLAIRKVGICGTDLHAFRGRQPFFTYPRVLGHELAADVVEIGDNDQGISPGDKVVPIPYIHCGKCIACRNGKTNCCDQLTVIGVHADGGMQQQFALSADLLIATPGLTYSQMAIVEPLAIGAHAVRRANLQPGDTVAVVGCGPIGLGLMKFAQLKGATVIALDSNEDRLNFAMSELDAQYAVNVLKDPVEQVQRLTGGELATCVFDATGNQQAMQSGPHYMSHGGTYVLVGLYNGPLQFLHPELHAKETTLLCSRNATREDFEQVIEVLSRGLFPVESYITHEVDYRHMVDQFESWTDPKSRVIKAMTNWK